jgi:hypothetical protein
MMRIRSSANFSVGHEPGTHECEHYERRPKRSVVLFSGLTVSPLCQAKHFYEQDPEEEKQDQPEAKQTQDRRQTRTVDLTISAHSTSKEGINIHSGLEQHIQAICPLHEFEGNTDKEQLLQLLNCETCLPEAHDEGSHETPEGDNDVKEIPSIGMEASPSKAVPPYDDVNDVNKHEDQEKII